MTTPAVDNELSLKISDVYTLCVAFEKALKVKVGAKVFDKEMTMELFPVWSRVMRFCEDVKRRTEVNDSFAEEAAAAALEEVPPLVESTGAEVVEIQSE
jgi:hypothetical protein